MEIDIVVKVRFYSIIPRIPRSLEKMSYRSIAIFIIILLSCCTFSESATSEKTKAERARTALEYVEKVRNSDCSGGTEESLPVEFDHSVWSHFADVAVRMSNILTKLIIQGENDLRLVTDEFLFDLVRNNVDGDSLIFGSAIAVERYTYPKYETFCPYAYKKENVHAHDISLNYDYLDPSTEWYNTLRQKNWDNADVSENWVTYRHNETSHATQQILYQPMARLEDGHWTSPYYDCGGGDIWMVTYSAPMFGLNQTTNKPIFQGIGTIDIELTEIDINQCDISDSSDSISGSESQVDKERSVDVFRGTHHCHPSTKCEPVAGEGFVRGSYVCACKDGFYFPQLDHPYKVFNGTVLENYYATTDSNETYDFLSKFQCTQCAEGCEVCVDDSPCLYSYKWGVRLIILAVTIILIVLTIVCSILVAIFKTRKAIKSASPIFLHIMNTGAVLMYLSMVVSFPEPNNITCVLKNWPQFIGFALAYGALLLKTWRISAIFKVKSARKMNLTDKVLSKHLAPILGVVLAFLIIWSAVGPRSETVWLRTASTDLKFLYCSNTFWEFIGFGGEACFLLWGTYLCYVVRKAPSHFNESKHITWTIYNCILLGSFVLIIRQFMAIPQGPDILYVVDFVYLQVSVTSMMCLIYIPKFVAVMKPESDVVDDAETVTGRTKTKIENLDANDVAVQTDLTSSDIAVVNQALVLQVENGTSQNSVKNEQMAPVEI